MQKKTLIFFMMISLGFHKIILEYSFIPISNTSKQINLAVFFLIMLLCMATKIRKISKVCYFEIALIFFTVLVGFYRGLNNNGLNFSEGARVSLQYYQIFLAIPITSLLLSDKWNLKKMLWLMCILTWISYVFRVIISVVYSISGDVIFPSIALESAASNWIRNGILRINPPCYSIIYLPALYYLLGKEKNVRKKYIIYIFAATDIFFEVFIHQARSVLLYHVMTLAIMWVFRNTSQKRALVRRCVAVLFSFVIYNTPIIQNLILSFSPGSKYGDTLQSRLLSYSYWFERFIQNPILGTGIISSEKQYFSIIAGQGHLADIGIVGSIFMFGIFMVVFYAIFFANSLKVTYNAKKNNIEEYILVLGITVGTLGVCINIDLFSDINAASVPFIIAIFEYIKILCKNQQRSFK